MALTRPRLGQLITNVASLTDNLTVINSAATQANVDVGFIFNRTDGVGSVANVALYWNETTKSFAYVYTADTGDLTNANIVSTGYANVASGNLTVTGFVNITNTGDVSANIGTLYSANVSTQANIGTLYLGNIATQANLGSYQIYANANAASQATSLNTINANLGGFQTYANTAINSIVTGANANTAAYLTTYSGNLTAGNISTAGVSGNISNVGYVFANNFVYNSNGINILSSVNANIGVLYLGNVATQANLGAYQTYANSVQIWANANVSGLQNQITGSNNSIQAANANIGSYQTWANANVSSLQNQVTGANNSIQAANANIGSYQTWANANVSSLQNQITGANNVIQASNANIGAYQIYANTQISTTQANLGAYQIYANANAATQAVSITSLASGANANTAAYLLTTTGNISAGNITTTGNINAAYIITTGATLGNISNVYAITANVFQFANGVNILSTATGTYSNANVTAYLTTASFTAPTANVSLLDQVTATSTNAVFYPPFFSATSGNLQNYVNTTLAFNPSAGYLYSPYGTFNSVYAAAFGNLNATFTGASISTTNGYIGTIDSTTVRAATIGNTGATLTGTLSTATQNSVTTMTGLVTIGATGLTTTVVGNLSIGGNLSVTGQSVSIGSTSLSIQDPIINLHSPSDLTPLLSNDGADIGIKMHYFNGVDSAAFLGRANDTGYLEWYGSGLDTANVFTGTTYGGIKAGSLILSNARVVGGGLTANTGTLQVYGDGSVSGNLYIGAGLIASGIDMVANAISQATSLNTINANLGAYQTYANTQISTTQANLGAYQMFANANVSSLQTQIFASNANTGAYQTFANANVSSLQNQITGANTNIQTTSANLGAYQTFANTQISTTQANLGAFEIWSNINSLTTQANLGAYQIYANAQISTTQANLGAYQTYANTNAQTTSANLGAYQTFANANVSGLQNQIFASNANIGAYQIYANTTNAATQANLGAYQTYANATNATTQANIGAFYTYANTTNSTTQANLGAYQIFANANAATQQTQITSITTNANANVAAYLLTATGNIQAGNIITAGTTSGNITGANVIFANTLVLTNNNSINSLQITGTASRGGAGYHDFLSVTNLASGATNPNKNFRLNSTGGLEIINSAYTTNIFSLTDAGALTLPSALTAGNIITTNGVYWSNGAPYSAGGVSSYGNAQVAQYLPVYGGTVNADQVWASNNGNGTNFKVGDDAWIGDINNSNTLGIKGQQDATQGYIVFGNSNYTNSIGRSGTGPINVSGAFAVAGNTIISGNLVAASTTSTTTTTAGSIVSSGGVGIAGNLIAAGYGQFSGIYNESSLTAGVFIGNAGSGTPSPRIGFFTGTTSLNWQIDNYGGTFRWFTPGVTRMQLDAGGNLSILASTVSTSTGSGALIVTGGAGIGGALYIANTGDVSANIGAYQIFANANAAIQQTQINSITSGANANVAAYLTTATGNISAGNLTVSGNLTVTNIIYTNSEIVSTSEIVAGNLVAAATTTSTSTTTGALVVKGGAGIAGNAIIGGNIQATGTVQYGSGQGGLIFQTLVGGTGAAIYNTNIVPSAQNYVLTTNGAALNLNAPSGGAVYTGVNNSIITTVQAGTPSSTQATGQSLVVSNGLGVTGASYFNSNVGIGGNLVVAGNTTIPGVIGTTQFYNSAYFYSPTNNFGELTANTTFNGLISRPINFISNSATMRIARPTISGDPAVELIGANWADGSMVSWWDFFTNTDQFNIRRRTGNSANIILRGSQYITYFPETNVIVQNGTVSTSTSTGAFQVVGGAGISGNLYVGGILNIANTGDVSANIGVLYLGNVATQANLGAFQTYANITNSTIQANLGSYQTWANTTNTATQANLGAYQLFANANVSSLQNQIFASNANIGSYQIYANANAALQATAITSLATNANANTAAYLTTATGNISASNLNITGNITATANIVAQGFLGVGNVAPRTINGLMINQNPNTVLNSSAALHIMGQSGTTPLLITDAFGTNQSSYIIGRKANGTAASPTAAGVGGSDCMAGLVGVGYGTSGWQTGNVKTLPGISVHTAEAYTDTAYGAQVELRSTPTGSNVAIVRLQVSANGSVSLSSTTDSNGPLSGALIVAGGAGFQGNIVSTGNVFAGGNLIVSPTASGLIGRTSNQTMLLVNPSSTVPPASTLFAPLVHFVGRDNQTTTVAIDCFGTSGCGYISRHGRGSLASPTAAGTNDCLGGVMGIGYGATGFSTANVDLMPGFKITASDTFTDTSMPTKLDLRTIPVGSNTAVISMSISAAGIVSITNTTDSTSTTSGALVVSGGIAAAGNITANAFYATGAGSATLSSNTNVNLTAINAVAVTQSVFRLASFTTSAASSLTAQAGDLIYNTTIGNVQIYNGSAFGNVVVSDVNGNIRATQFTFANGVNILSTIAPSSTYSNANVASYLPTDSTFTGYLTFANANAALQATSINAINANLGAYQTYANTTNAVTQANIGSYQIYANAAIQTLSANIGTLVAGAPDALNTLYEIDQSLGNNTSLSATLINSIAGVQANVIAANLRIAGLNSTGNVTFVGNLQYNSNGVSVATANPGPFTYTDPGSGSGSGAVFTVVNNLNGTYGITLVNGGTNYSNSDVIVIPGASLGGVTSANNLSITVTGQNFGTITTYTSSGTPVTAYAWRFTSGGNIVIPTTGAINYANGYSILDSINARELATNAAIVTANTSVVSYVNTVANSLATGANVNAAAYFGTFGGNLRAGFINLTGNIYAAYSNVTLLTGAQPNITSVGTLNSLAVTGNISANGISSVGNVSARSMYSSGNIVVGGGLLLGGKLFDINGNAGLSGQYLVSTSTGTQWYSPTGSGGGGTLAGLGDVNLSSPQAQQVLTYNGTYWVNAAAGVTVASAVFASSQSDMGLVTDGVLSVQEDEGLVTQVSNNIYDLGVLSFTGIISLNNIDQSIKSDYLSYSIIFGF